MFRAAVVALVTLPALALAQPAPYGAPPPYGPGPAQDRRELRQDRRELAQDRWDAAVIEQLLARYDGALTRRDRRAIGAVENDALRMLDREIRQARIEVARSAGEARRERREVRAEMAQGDRLGAREDRRDLRDDRRDLRDDRQDLRRIEALRSEFWSLRGRMHPRALERKRALLANLVEVARAEIREDRGEQREDRREGWEQHQR